MAEEGTHWELIDKEGSLYADMWKKYLREREIKEGEKLGDTASSNGDP